eukprot:435377_1
MSSWYDCVCCNDNGNQSIVKLKQKESKREIKQVLLDQKHKIDKHDDESRKKWSKDISIVIIGAGHAGIHMALLLIESGYKNVKILERKHNIGGRLLCFKDKRLDIIHELGTNYIYKNYTELINLKNKFDKNKELIQINENTYFYVAHTVNKYFNNK